MVYRFTYSVLILRMARRTKPISYFAMATMTPAGKERYEIKQSRKRME